MIIPTRGKILAVKISREKVLSSGIIIPERLKGEKIDNVARVLGVGSPARKSCYLCHDKTACKLIRKGRYCKEHGKVMPMIARRTDIIHYKEPFAQKLRYEGQDYIFLTSEAIVAIEREEKMQAVGSMVIIKLVRQENVGSIILSDGAKTLEGEFYGKVISVGPDFPDKSLKSGDKLHFLRDEGYRWTSYYAREEYLSIKEKWVAARVDNDQIGIVFDGRTI